MESILESIKKLLGVSAEDDSFDAEIIMHINTAISILTQLGVGPIDGFQIHGPIETWENFIGVRKDMDLIKGYIFNRVRLIFDTPANSFLVRAIEEQIKEFEWRLEAKG